MELGISITSEIFSKLKNTVTQCLRGIDFGSDPELVVFWGLLFYCLCVICPKDEKDEKNRKIMKALLKANVDDPESLREVLVCNPLVRELWEHLLSCDSNEKQ